MASTVNSDNGAVSGSAGLKTAADSSGVLALQTNGTTAVTVGTDQNAVFNSTGAVTLPVGTTAQRPGTPANGMMRINTTAGTLEVYSSLVSAWITVSTFAAAPTAIELMIVAGGGGGGTLANGGRGGGGGAGGLLYYGAETPKTPNGAAVAVTTGVAYTITVGGGGIASNTGTIGDGVNSSMVIGATTYTSVGGGGGAANDGLTGHTGGSGGGSWYNGTVGGSGTAGQGNAGGFGAIPANYGGGGGGGAGVAGGNGSSAQGGSGGNGLAYVISGSSTYYAGGGSGDLWAGTATTNPGTAGLGGGGTGQNITGGTNGTANTGGGGGAGSGLGGSGVVILRYPDAYTAAVSTTGSPTVTVAGGYRVYKFTASGTITF
jgi:hypothetical protein